MMSVRRGVCHIGDGRHFWRGVCRVFVASMGFWLQVRMAWAPPELCHRVGGQMPRDYLVGLKTSAIPWRRIALSSKRSGRKRREEEAPRQSRPPDSETGLGKWVSIEGSSDTSDLQAQEHQSGSQH